MALEHVKSASVINADASPSVANTAGEGGPAPLKNVTGIAIGTPAADINSTFQMCRVPSNAKVKSIIFHTETQGAGNADIGLYFATDGQGGKPTVLVVANAIDRDFFAAAFLLTTAVATDVTNLPTSTAFSPDKRNMPLWQAAGLTSDPGGNFDIVLSLTAAITAGGGDMVMNVNYTD